MKFTDYTNLASLLGAELSLFWIIPFVGILLSIAILPLIKPILWHHNYGKISAFWALSFILPFIYSKGISVALHKIMHVMFIEYLPFIILLLSLYTISGGIRLKGRLPGTPKSNVLIILIGTILASWMGTTGASMLLIRPLLRANKWRQYTVHTIVFFIFLVANIGGALTPLGDPPLFLGFLHGVDFFWTTQIMLFPMCLVSIVLLIIYYLIDSFYYRKEQIPNSTTIIDNEPIGIEGTGNILLLLCVISTVLMSGFWQPEVNELNIFGIHIKIQNITRDIILIILVFMSWRMTDRDIRNKNGFTWFPIQEVAKLFAGIFITIIPVIAILQAGAHGALHPIIEMITDAEGNPVNSMYFWLTGILSGFLDNAPTYLVFFNIAGSSAPEGTIIAEYLMRQMPVTLMAISAGAVFLGALTYIGNAPNFMVQSIAEENNIKMPSFFGYMLWSMLILIPILLIVSILLF
jgi:Na+/H+ antiporter NhaD/arsenite permease-like protein